MTATATGLLVPELPIVAPDATVVAKDASATIAVTEFAKNITNTGAITSATFTFPAASSVAGMPIRFYLTVDQIVKITPASGEKIFLAGSGVASKYLQIAGVIGNFVDIFCDGMKFLVTKYSGVLTKET